MQQQRLEVYSLAGRLDLYQRISKICIDAGKVEKLQGQKQLKNVKCPLLLFGIELKTTKNEIFVNNLFTKMCTLLQDAFWKQSIDFLLEI